MSKRQIILFYKRLIKPGGAERLLLKEYQYFKSQGYDTKIVCFEFNKELSFQDEVNPTDMIIINRSSTLTNVLALAGVMKDYNEHLFLCNSGYIDFYMASVISNTGYSLHIHQPSFMSFNEKDKYSLFMKKAFTHLVHSNHGAKRFVKIKQTLSLMELIGLNLRTLISIRAVKKAKSVFVLSDYAKREKKEMYDIDAYNYTGALENSIFNYVVTPVEEYRNYKYKLISIARLDINKRLDELIIGFSEFIKKEPSSILLIGGTGEEYNNLDQLIKTLQIQDNVKLLGFVPDNRLYDYYAWADLFVSIDWADFRITSYEAMAVGTKVLLSDETDPNQELLESGYYYLCEPTSEKVAVAIEKALLNENVVSKQALFSLLKNYTWDQYFRKIEKVL